jgi:hypothetical protein
MTVNTNPLEPFDYVKRSDRDKIKTAIARGDPAPTVPTFKLKPLSNAQRAALEDLQAIEPGTQWVKVRAGTRQRECLRAGLDGWKNYTDKTGTQREFVRSDRQEVILGQRVFPPSEESLNVLDWDLDVGELSAAIEENARLTIEEGKG